MKLIIVLSWLLLGLAHLANAALSGGGGQQRSFWEGAAWPRVWRRVWEGPGGRWLARAAPLPSVPFLLADFAFALPCIPSALCL